MIWIRYGDIGFGVSDANAISNSCEIHSKEGYHPGRNCWLCYVCGAYFNFCDRDGPMVLRVLAHRCLGGYVYDEVKA